MQLTFRLSSFISTYLVAEVAAGDPNPLDAAPLREYFPLTLFLHFVCQVGVGVGACVPCGVYVATSRGLPIKFTFKRFIGTVQ